MTEKKKKPLEKPAVKPEAQPSPPPSVEAPELTPTPSPAGLAASTDSPKPLISEEGVRAAEQRIADAQSKPKRKYTKRDPNRWGEGAGGVQGSPLASSPTGEKISVSSEEAEYMLNFPFNALAESTQYEKFRLPPEKVKECSPLAAKVIAQYFPQIQGPHAALVALCLSLSVHSISATFGYWKEVKRREKEEAEAKNRAPVAASESR